MKTQLAFVFTQFLSTGLSFCIKKFVKPFVVIIIATGILLSACEQNNPQLHQQIASAKDYFFPLKVGNYWVYRTEAETGVYPNYTLDTFYDTLRIVSDTLINSITYYQLTGSLTTLANFYGDSAGYIVYREGILFELDTVPNAILRQDTTDAGFFYRVYRTGSIDTNITVPVGSFICIETILDAHYLVGNPPSPNANPRSAFWYYAENVGLVKSITWYAAASGKITSELVDYHLIP